LNQKNQAELSDNSALVQRLRKLSQKKFRKSLKEFLVEGPSAVEEGLKANQISHVFSTRDYDDYRALIPLASSRLVPCSLISKKSLDKITETSNPAGIIAISNLQISEIDHDKAGKLNQIIYLDQIQDPGNAGTIIRGAAAFGFSAVVFSTDSVDPTNLKTVRSTAGSLFQIPIFMSTSLEDFHHWGFEVWLTDANAEKEILDVPVNKRQVWVFSNEARGLRRGYDFAKSLKIPIKTQTESLNVAQAASILMFHVANKISDV